MERRASILLALLTTILFGVSIFSSLPAVDSAKEPFNTSILPDNTRVIELGAPEFEIDREWRDGSMWSTIDLVNGLNPPTNGEPSIPVISHPLIVPYEVLDIRRSASWEDIEKAYKMKVKEYHPDKFIHAPERIHKAAKEETERLNIAFEKLKRKFRK